MAKLSDINRSGPVFFETQCIYHKDFHLTRNMYCCYITLWKSKIQRCYWLWQHFNRLFTCSWGHFDNL